MVRGVAWDVVTVGPQESGTWEEWDRPQGDVSGCGSAVCVYESMKCVRVCGCVCACVKITCQ